MNGGLLTFDVSNTHTGIALWHLEDRSVAPGSVGIPAPKDLALEHWQIASSPSRTPDELRVLLLRLLEDRGIDVGSVEACAAACVVPELAAPLRAACQALFGVETLFIGPGLRSGMRIRTENPREVGPDRIANALAAQVRFGMPAIVFDFATALTVDVIDEQGDYAGAVIAPGLDVAAQALTSSTARLGRFDLKPPPTVIANDTVNALRSGVVYGYIGLVEGLVRRVRDDIGDAPAIATGEATWLEDLLAQTEVFDAFAPLLTLDGIRRIYELNR